MRQGTSLAYTGGEKRKLGKVILFPFLLVETLVFLLKNKVRCWDLFLGKWRRCGGSLGRLRSPRAEHGHQCHMLSTHPLLSML